MSGFFGPADRDMDDAFIYSMVTGDDIIGLSDDRDESYDCDPLYEDPCECDDSDIDF